MLDMDIISVLTIRSATSDDRAQLRRAIVELQDYECLLHATRLPGAQVADAYVDWMLEQTNTTGIVLVAEVGATFVGFVAGWIEETTNLGETPDSNRLGLVSDIFVVAKFRGHRIATRLLHAIEQYFRRACITRLRITALAVNTAARASYEHAGFAPYEIVHEKLLLTNNREVDADR